MSASSPILNSHGVADSELRLLLAGDRQSWRHSSASLKEFRPGVGPSEPSLRARLTLAGNRSQRYAPVGSSNVTGWCSGMPASSLGAHPAVIIHSEEIRGVDSLRREVGYQDERHFMHLSINARPWLAFVYVGRDARCSASHCSLIHPRSEPCVPRDMLSFESIAAAVIAIRARKMTICSVHGTSPVSVP